MLTHDRRILKYGVFRTISDFPKKENPVFRTVRSAIARLLGHKDEAQTAPTPKQPEPAATRPEPRTPRYPYYRSLNEAVEQAQNGELEKARGLLRHAYTALRPFPHTRSLYLAGAAVVNAMDDNIGTARRSIEAAMVWFQRDYGLLSPAEQDFVTTACALTLRRVPIEKLTYGQEITDDRQEAENLCRAGRYGEAIYLLKRAARAVHANPWLRNHPAKPWNTLLAMIDNVYTAIEHQGTTARLRHLYYGETGEHLSQTMATAA